MNRLVVSEVFGPTVQGEGPSMGRRCAFVRLGRCNLDCRWCDTSYTWDWQGKNGIAYDPAKELHTMAPEDIAAQVTAMHVGLLVVSGGEPLLQSGLGDLVSIVDEDVEIETNGTRIPSPLMGECRFNVSPKLTSSGVPREKAWVDAALHWFVRTERATFKFVIGGERDLVDLGDFLTRYDVSRGRVWLMPQTAMNGSVPELTATEVVDAALALGAQFSGRLHVDLWGHDRGH